MSVQNAKHKPPLPGPSRLRRWQLLALVATAALLWGTGLAWLATHYSVGAGAGELPHPIEIWSMRLHGVGAFAGLFMLGVLAAVHMPHGWLLSHRPRWAAQRKSGALLCLLAGLLVLSGYLLYYFAPEPVRPTLGWLHVGIGVVMALIAAQHCRRH
jgi:hypothetical protein